MEAEKYSLIVSPENISTDIFRESYSGDSGSQTFGVYSGMSYILSGGTGGTSLLTGLTIPIMLTQTMNDIGFYSEFDGLMLQKDVLSNFLFSADTLTPYDVNFYNTSGDIEISFLKLSSFFVDWGDGTPTQQVGTQPLTHTYPTTPSIYTITFSGQNNWGLNIIEKPIVLPLTGTTITNLQGNFTFTPQGGYWSGIPISYDFIATGDSQNNVSSQISSSYTTIPFPVSGYTKSKLTDVKRWGPNPYTVGYTFIKNGVPYGQINSITPDYTSYTLNDITYYDFPNGQTLYLLQSSGFTQNDLLFSAITKNEYLLDFVMDPEVQSDVYIERGKYSAFEPLQRLGEVDNIGDMVRYGYGYYKINTT